MKFNLAIVLTILLFSLIFPIDAKKHGKKIDKKNDKNCIKDICNGKKKGNGKQIKSGFCTNTPLGLVPSVEHMASTLIIEPKNEGTLKANKDFAVVVKVKNLHTGNFSDPESQYYVEPQQLNDNGLVLGHAHISIQRLDDEKHPPNAKEFAFFEGLNSPAKGGILKETKVKLSEAGKYRICVMTSSFTHQPLIMPVAKRGHSDDCIRVNVKKY